MRDGVVLAEHTSQIAPGEEDGPGPVVSLDKGLFAEMGGDGVDFDGLGTDETDACFLVAVYAAQARAEVAVPEMGVGCGALFGEGERGEELVPGGVGV